MRSDVTPLLIEPNRVDAIAEPLVWDRDGTLWGQGQPWWGRLDASL